MANIKEIRAKTRLSQSRFADEFGIPVRTLQQWEQEKSSPPEYVISMIEAVVSNRMAKEADTSSDASHFIRPRTSWRVCIANPFDNCERIYPLQQRKVRELIDDIIESENATAIWVFGSSVTESCHIGSDVDLFIETESTSPVKLAHDFEYDAWTSATVDDRLKAEIMRKGVKVYG